LPGCTAYYEPFNERRWFDPRTRGERVDATRRNVACRIGRRFRSTYLGLIKQD
jgi:hypothetical protein